MSFNPTRRHLLTAAGGLGLSLALPRLAAAAGAQRAATDATFLFSCDVHACLVSADGLSPNCAAEGKTDAALLRHVGAVNAVGGLVWPAASPPALRVPARPSPPRSASCSAAT